MQKAGEPENDVHKVGGTSKQSTISGWGEHDVRISVPFTWDTTHANTEIMRDCHVFGTLAKQA